MGNPTKHFPFSASAAERWFNCPGSWKLEQAALVNDAGKFGNDASRLGTAVHAMIEDRMQTMYPAPASGLLNSIVHIDKDGDARIVEPGAGNVAGKPGCFISVTPDMVRDAQLCLDLVEKILDAHPAAYEAGTYFSELKTEIIPDTLGGTADIVIIDGDWAGIIDYKNGTNHVDVVDNLQLQIYALGVLENIKAAEHVERWTLCIVQPNDYSDPQKIRTWKTTTDELNHLFYLIGSAIEDCKGLNDQAVSMEHKNSGGPSVSLPSNTFKAGEWCQWCKVKDCPAEKKAALEFAKNELPDLPIAQSDEIDVTKWSVDQLKWVLDNQKLISKRIKKVTSNLEDALNESVRRMQRGDTIPGYKLVESRKNRTVVDPNGLSKAAEENGWDVWRQDFKTLGELDKEVPKSELAKYVQKPAGAPTWAPESDKRPAIGNLLAGIDEVE